jgi:hypothetical protein
VSRERNVRLSQTLAPFGVGAIYDILGESLVACETGWWGNAGQRLRLPRLEKQLGVDSFRAAPSHASLFGGSSPGLPYYRFPQWLFCPRCRRMTQWRERMEVAGEPPRCHMDNCPGKAQLVPMRFVMACPEGHLDDVPWQFWTHVGAKSDNQKQCKSRDLSFSTRRDAGAGLASLQVRCNTCKAVRSLSGISTKDSLKPYRIRCSGRQPWQRFEAAETCGETPQVLQRGATNVYFALVQSAIDIPPESNYASFSDLAVEVINTPEFEIIRSAPTGPLSDMLAQQLAEQFDTTLETVMSIVQSHVESESGAASQSDVATDESDLATEEWLAFQSEREEDDDRDRFITKLVDFLEPGCNSSAAAQVLHAKIGRVILATRLREVRALVSFSRYRPDARQLAPDLGRGLAWLPAIEVFGEGLFLSLDEGQVSAWESDDSVQALAAQLEHRRLDSLFGPRLGVTSTPRFLLLHSLAHILIRQLAFECGYAASSLRERIYAKQPSEGDPQAGLLIYTAAGDVEGTLGGLVRQGEPPRLANTLLRALETASWCSSDPLCRESTGQGFGAMNLGACYACSLVSETSCAHFNVLLDRGFLVGSDRVTGYFEGVLAAATLESASALVEP